MTINFFGPDDVPQPRDKVKIESLDVLVLPDRGRVQVNINLTPFMVRPNVAVALVRADGDPPIAADMTIIETMHNTMEFTMHIRGEGDPAGDYTLKARLYYEQGVLEPDDEAQFAFAIPGADDDLG